MHHENYRSNNRKLSHSKTYRVFFAITLPEEHKIELHHWQTALFKTTVATQPRWVATSKIHLTLQFIAHLPPEKLLSLTQAVSSELSAFQSFDLQTSLITYLFPSSQKPKCLILKVAPEQPLSALSQTIGQAMQETGIIPEKRRFKPHLTLARFDAPAEALPTLQLPHAIAFRVTEVVLLKSQTHPEGAIYSLLERFPLLGLTQK